MKPQLTPNGMAVRLPLAAHVGPLLDYLAVAYAEDPETVGLLLAVHAERVEALDHAVVSPVATDYERAMRRADADASLEALLTEANRADDLNPVLTADDAVTLSTRLVRLAAHIRLTPKKAR